MGVNPFNLTWENFCIIGLPLPCGNCLSKHFYDGHVGGLWNSDIIINISDIIIINYDIRNINYDISAFTYSRLINATSFTSPGPHN